MANMTCKPQRIVSLAPSNTEILYALGLGERIVAVTSYCDYPPEAQQKPHAGSWIKIDDDLIAQHKPDLILTSTVVQGEAEARYRERGLPIVHFDPTTLDMVHASILGIGELTGVPERAAALMGAMRNDIRQVTAQVQGSQPKPRVYIEEWHAPPMMSGNWVPDMVVAAGGQYGIVQSGQYSREVNTDEVLAFAPEVIVLSICGLALRASTVIIYKRTAWQDLPAVHNRRVYVADDSLFNRPGPRLVEGIRWLASILHS